MMNASRVSAASALMSLDSSAVTPKAVSLASDILRPRLRSAARSRSVDMPLPRLNSSKTRFASSASMPFPPPSTSATTTTLSFTPSRRHSLRTSNAPCTVASASSAKSSRKGRTPYSTAIALRTDGDGVKAKMGAAGRQRDTSDAISPFCVNTTIAAAPRDAASDAAVLAMFSATWPMSAFHHRLSGLSASFRSGSLASRVGSCCCSAFCATAWITDTARNGKRPAAVSEVSCSASAFCVTASKMSLTSARVGVGYITIESRK
mmetsp:Transcript_11231/g.28397  ORF Transcript_11231/g.28397 Transcript_11231/m.28397 type:complete len:263 (-) Transcript_11231:812-1600(-)